jgi:hypothetical protein
MFVKIGKNGKPLPKGSRAKAVAFLEQKTGLMWDAADPPGGAKKWADAIEAAKAVRTAGFADWRAPTQLELETLRDLSRFNPASDPVLGLKSTWYWSSTPAASSPSDYAWSVHFNLGLSYFNYQYDDGLVRPVRSARARQ